LWQLRETATRLPLHLLQLNVSSLGERTHASDDAISEAEIGCTFPGTNEDQQLVLDEHGFGHHGTRRRDRRVGRDRRQEMKERDGHVAHATTAYQDREIQEMLMNFCN
jgi:hypothetical protein